MSDLIYIGRFSQMDTNEANNTIERPELVEGTYKSGDMQNVSVRMTSNYRASQTQEDDVNNQGDAFTYDLGEGETSSVLDAAGRYAAEIKDSDGDSHKITISVYQTQNGDAFIRLPDGYNITEIKIGKICGDGYSSITQGASSTSKVVCFCAGTLIETERGAEPVEQLKVGDLVRTMDRGLQPITWIESWTVERTEKTAPVRIRRGSFGDGKPQQDLYVSRQHRLLLRSPIAERMFGALDVLVPAHRLVGLPGVELMLDGGPVTYAHFTCPNHEIIDANGVPAETMLLGKMTLEILGPSNSVTNGYVPENPIPARRLEAPKRLAKLAERHRNNQKSFAVAALH